MKWECDKIVMANNRLPYGLCKKYGIELPQGATPREAWAALHDIGIQYIEDKTPITLSPSFYNNNEITIKLPDITLPKSVGSKWRNETVIDFSTNKKYKFADNSKLQNVEVFCGYGTKTIYKDAYKYAEKLGGLPEEWQHVKAIGELVTDEGILKAEVHWSQHKKFGKRDFFIKRWID